MSNIQGLTNRHNVLPFVAGESKALSGQRLAKVGYKQTKAMTDKGEVAPQSICVSLPMIVGQDIRENLESLLPHIGAWLETVQDNVLRSLYEARKYELSSVSDEELSIGQCVNYLEAESSGGRLTKEYLDGWFTREIADSLYVVIADKLGFVPADAAEGSELEVTPDQDSVVQKHLNGYRALMVGLTGKNLSLDQKQVNGLRKALELCAPAECAVTPRLMSKLDQIEKESRELLVDLL